MNATRIRLEREGEWWVATDLATGVASQGRSRDAALEMLDDALAGHDVAGLLTEQEAADAKEAVDSLREGDRDRLDGARDAVEDAGE